MPYNIQQSVLVLCPGYFHVRARYLWLPDLLGLLSFKFQLICASKPSPFPINDFCSLCFILIYRSHRFKYSKLIVFAHSVFAEFCIRGAFVCDRFPGLGWAKFLYLRFIYLVSFQTQTLIEKRMQLTHYSFVCRNYTFLTPLWARSFHENWNTPEDHFLVSITTITARMLQNGKLSELVEIQTGVRQGCGCRHRCF